MRGPFSEEGLAGSSVGVGEQPCSVLMWVGVSPSRKNRGRESEASDFFSLKNSFSFSFFPNCHSFPALHQLWHWSWSEASEDWLCHLEDMAAIFHKSHELNGCLQDFEKCILQTSFKCDMLKIVSPWTLRILKYVKCLVQCLLQSSFQNEWFPSLCIFLPNKYPSVFSQLVDFLVLLFIDFLLISSEMQFVRSLFVLFCTILSEKLFFCLLFEPFRVDGGLVSREEV